MVSTRSKAPEVTELNWVVICQKLGTIHDTQVYGPSSKERAIEKRRELRSTDPEEIDLHLKVTQLKEI